MPVIIKGIEQGGDEWHNLRLGIPTASRMGEIVTTNGQPSKQARKYMLELATERITGQRISGFRSWQMEEGNRREQESREYYELVTGDIVDQVTFVFADDRKLYGCSPDGLIGEVGGFEVKNPEAHTHMDRVLSGGKEIPTGYIVQVQASLMITGREWWDFMSYYPGLKPLIIRVEPDFKLHRAIKQHVDDFCGELEMVVDRYTGI